jgi:hypothetical protein
MSMGMLERKGLFSGHVAGLAGEACGESDIGFWKGKKVQFHSEWRMERPPGDLSFLNT